MRRILAWIGATALVLIVAAVAGFGYLFARGYQLDKDSRAYADAAVRPVVEHWDQQALLDRASPELLASGKPEQLASVFQWLRTLGALKELEPCAGEARFDVNSNSGSTVTGRYTCKASFAAGDAQIQVLLLKRQGEWRIFGFHVDSPALVPRDQSKKI